MISLLLFASFLGGHMASCKVLLFDVQGQTLPRLLHSRVRNLLLITLLLHQLLIESILLFSNRIDAIEVIHVFDRRWASTLHVFALIALPLWSKLLA